MSTYESRLAKVEKERDALREAIQHYEAALKLSWPEGAKGGAFDCWNYARIALHGDAALEGTK